jgi:hypothetical protein
MINLGYAFPDFSSCDAQFDPPGPSIGFVAQSLKIVLGFKACDDDAASITGQVFNVSGGLTMSG